LQFLFWFLIARDECKDCPALGEKSHNRARLSPLFLLNNSLRRVFINQLAHRIVNLDPFLIETGVQPFDQLTLEPKGSNIIRGVVPNLKVDV
jgi:hypothetical protein